MKLKKSLWTLAVAAIAIGIAGCNLFNPTQSVDIASGDAEALTYEGYLHYQKTEYLEAQVYFDKALSADPRSSEAWYGRAKAILSMQPALNVFELLRYARPNGTNLFSGFQYMTDQQAYDIDTQIDIVLREALDPFILLDTTGRLDGKIRFAQIVDSYSILVLTKWGIAMRNCQLNFNDLVTIDTSGIHYNMNSNTCGGNGMNSFEKFIGATLENPHMVAQVLMTAVPQELTEYITPAGFEKAVEVGAQAYLETKDLVTGAAEGMTQQLGNLFNKADEQVAGSDQ
ncbi:tetratricopeptide repeat protein [Fibrobacter sp. UBA4309]|uniref:tetratricopeptide repeat protein n=1 Tax=Fibrobacter sp. UBA4309 TaxID=1946537 RepID=UPI0025BD6B4A|nr:tetratricopeptide repeat protein [Fibrobacter sp. UBA4309]